MKTQIRPRLVGLAAFCVALAIQGRAAADPISGAIFTSNVDGTIVDQNLYQNKQDVYLNGGPQNNQHAGLPDGIYYFQVTDPSGATLLSTDPAADRQLQVVNGRVDGVGGTGTHNNGNFNSSDSSTPVQLFPFADTPNPGGEYKAWLIPVGDATVEGDGITLDFSNSDAKTDNFKVQNMQPIPEPSTMALAGLGVICLAPWLRRRSAR